MFSHRARCAKTGTASANRAARASSRCIARTVQRSARAVVILRDHARATRGPRERAGGPTTAASAGASIVAMTDLQRRLAGSALAVGGVLAIAGYLAAGTLAGGSG